MNRKQVITLQNIKFTHTINYYHPKSAYNFFGWKWTFSVRLFLAQATVYNSIHWLCDVFVYPCINSHACGINSLNTFAMVFNTITINYQSQGCWCNSNFAKFVKMRHEVSGETTQFLSRFCDFIHTARI